VLVWSIEALGQDSRRIRDSKPNTCDMTGDSRRILYGEL
jgi:hypothetical protein